MIWLSKCEEVADHRDEEKGQNEMDSNTEQVS